MRRWNFCFVALEPDARPVKARPRTYSFVKVAWLTACITMLM